MFITDELAMGVGPRGLKPGDKLWKFHGDRFFAVIRGQGDHFKVLGRAVIADKELHWDARGNGFRMPCPSFVGGEYKIGKGPETQVNIDISVLQALTCPLRWKGFHRGVHDVNQEKPLKVWKGFRASGVSSISGAS